MSEESPLYVQGGGTKEYTAINMRTHNAALLGGRVFESLSAGTGAVGRGHGILASDALEVTANPTPDDTVLVAAGMCSIRGTQSDNQGSYICTSSSTQTLTISSKDATNTRVDYAVARVKDAFYPLYSGDTFDIEIVEGTAGSGAPTVPDDTLVLAEITVVPGAGATEITNSDIEDLRPHARVTGGIVPVSVRSDFPSPQEYDIIWEYSTESTLIYLNGSWSLIGQNLEGLWEVAGTAGSRFNNVTLGTGGDDYLRIVKLGRFVTGIGGFKLGTGGSVDGKIEMNLPSNAEVSGDLVYVGAARGSQASQDPIPQYGSMGRIDPSDSQTILTNFSTAGQAPWNSTIPFTWQEDDQVVVTFMYREEA